MKISVEQQKALYKQGLKEMGITEQQDECSTEFESIVNDFEHYCGYNHKESIRSAKNVLLNEHLN